MVVTIDPQYQIGAGLVVVSLPTHWTNDIVTSSRLPVTNLMSCVGYSPLIAPVLTCFGNESVYTITILLSLSAMTMS